MQKTYSVFTEADELTGDIIVPLPQELLDELGWTEGVLLSMEVVGSAIIIKKVE